MTVKHTEKVEPAAELHAIPKIKEKKEIPVIKEHKSVAVKKIAPLQKKKTAEKQQKTADTVIQKSPEVRHDTTDRQDGKRATESRKTVASPAAKADAAGLRRQDTPVSIKAVPLYEHNPAPRYPALARKRGIEGTVLLNVLVDRHGKVADLQIAETSGHKILDKAAIRAVERWIFSPGTTNNENTDMWVHVPVRFALQD